MDLPDCTTYQPADSEYVFAVLRDLHRFQTCGRRDLSLDTLVFDWELDSEFGGWKDIARGMNWFWGIDYSWNEWRSVLVPASDKRLRDVCDFIARKARRPIIQPLHLLGHECMPAGAFLAVRSSLQRAGLKTGHLTPSTPLADCRYTLMMASQVSRLAPGMLPVPEVVHPLSVIGILGMVIGLPAAAVGIVLIAMAVAEGSWIAACGGGIALAVFPASMALYYTRPLSVTFGPLRTFGDLAKALAAPRSGAQQLTTDH